MHAVLRGSPPTQRRGVCNIVVGRGIQTTQADGRGGTRARSARRRLSSSVCLLVGLCFLVASFLAFKCLGFCGCGNSCSGRPPAGLAAGGPARAADAKARSAAKGIWPQLVQRHGATRIAQRWLSASTAKLISHVFRKAFAGPTQRFANSLSSTVEMSTFA